MDILCSQLAEQYGPDVANELVNRSRSNLKLDALPSLPHTPSSESTLPVYDALTPTKEKRGGSKAGHARNGRKH